MNSQVKPMHLRVLNWNIGGAKYLGLRKPDRGNFRQDLKTGLEDLLNKYKPHVITIQEIVEYAEPGEAKEQILEVPHGYAYHPCILIDTNRHPYVSKWAKIQRKGNWPRHSYFGQGSAMLWQTDLPHFPVFALPDTNIKHSGNQHVEDVILMSGLYFGDRNTEPRAALVAHFVISKHLQQKTRLTKPLDVFVVCLHLTTLMNEREGIPEIDQRASDVRMEQLDIVLDGIVSRYNLWGECGFLFPGERVLVRDRTSDRFSAIWVLTGDFNFTEESSEYKRITRMNFIDVCPDKDQGTKGSEFRGNATITCDYIFAGPKYVSLEPTIVENAVQNNPKPDYSVKVSDHYPIFAEVPLTLMEKPK